MIFFKALLIPCEIPVDKPANPIVDAILGATDLTKGRAICINEAIPSPLCKFILFLASDNLYLIFPF